MLRHKAMHFWIKGYSSRNDGLLINTKEKREKCEIPDDVSFMTKPRLAAEMLHCHGRDSALQVHPGGFHLWQQPGLHRSCPEDDRENLLRFHLFGNSMFAQTSRCRKKEIPGQGQGTCKTSAFGEKRTYQGSDFAKSSAVSTGISAQFPRAPRGRSATNLQKDPSHYTKTAFRAKKSGL